MSSRLTDEQRRQVIDEFLQKYPSASINFINAHTGFSVPVIKRVIEGSKIKILSKQELLKRIIDENPEARESELAKLVGVATSTISNYKSQLRKAGLIPEYSRPVSSMTAKEIEQAERYRRSGMSFKEISVKMGKCDRKISRAVGHIETCKEAPPEMPERNAINLLLSSKWSGDHVKAIYQ